MGKEHKHLYTKTTQSAHTFRVGLIRDRLTRKQIPKQAIKQNNRKTITYDMELGTCDFDTEASGHKSVLKTYMEVSILSIYITSIKV